MTARERCRDVVRWRRAVLASDLPHAAKVVAMVLHEHMAWKKADSEAGARCFPGLDKIAAEAGTSRRTVVRCLDRLADAGYIDRLRTRGGKTSNGSAAVNNYAATLPLPGPQAPVDAPGGDDANSDNGAANSDNGDTSTGTTRPPNKHEASKGTSVSSNGTPSGVLAPNGKWIEEPQQLDDYTAEQLGIEDPFQLGRLLADLENNGEAVGDETVVWFAGEWFGADHDNDEATKVAFAGYRRYLDEVPF